MSGSQVASSSSYIPTPDVSYIPTPEGPATPTGSYWSVINPIEASAPQPLSSMPPEQLLWAVSSRLLASQFPAELTEPDMSTDLPGPAVPAGSRRRNRPGNKERRRQQRRLAVDSAAATSAATDLEGQAQTPPWQLVEQAAGPLNSEDAAPQTRPLARLVVQDAIEKALLLCRIRGLEEEKRRLGTTVQNLETKTELLSSDKEALLHKVADLQHKIDSNDFIQHMRSEFESRFNEQFQDYIKAMVPREVELALTVQKLEALKTECLELKRSESSLRSALEEQAEISRRKDDELMHLELSNSEHLQQVQDLHMQSCNLQEQIKLLMAAVDSEASATPPYPWVLRPDWHLLCSLRQVQDFEKLQHGENSPWSGLLEKLGFRKFSSLNPTSSFGQTSSSLQALGSVGNVRMPPSTFPWQLKPRFQSSRFQHLPRMLRFLR
eukprot:TRINITY_DN3321_c0_g1_i1.p1 TRINITY_DN3321_c0_g1~~TRINITY_DN3321_c0_g1_i1.p1  ORF type:complete len:437 (-),score=84.24 TRINITY_DN3321_c0_g1_i1:155-1465(-)